MKAIGRARRRLRGQGRPGSERCALYLRLENSGAFYAPLHRHQRATPAGCRGGGGWQGDIIFNNGEEQDNDLSDVLSGL